MNFEKKFLDSNLDEFKSLKQQFRKIKGESSQYIENLQKSCEQDIKAVHKKMKDMQKIILDQQSFIEELTLKKRNRNGEIEGSNKEIETEITFNTHRSIGDEYFAGPSATKISSMGSDRQINEESRISVASKTLINVMHEFSVHKSQQSRMQTNDSIWVPKKKLPILPRLNLESILS